VAPHLPQEVAVNLSLALVSSSTAPLLLLDRDLRVVAASASFCGAFGIDPTKVGGSRLGELGAGEWNKSQLVSLLNATASGYAKVENYEIDLLRKGHAARRLVLNAQKLHYGEEDNVRLVLSAVDVTDARTAEKVKEELVREKEVLLQELHHRVANSLQIIASVLTQSARKVQSEEARVHLVDAHQRVMSVAALQKQLAVTRLGDVELRPYFTALCESIGASMISNREQVLLDVTVDDSITTADTSTSLGLIVTELVINALKHAFPDNRSGRISVSYRTRGANWILSVDDDGVGFSEDPDHAKPGLGTGIVEALAKQLGAHVDIETKKSGTKVSIVHTAVAVLMGKTPPPLSKAAR
jgi:two-component system, sensor histidine kinase PdtaS